MRIGNTGIRKGYLRVARRRLKILVKGGGVLSRGKDHVPRADDAESKNERDPTVCTALRCKCRECCSRVVLDRRQQGVIKGPKERPVGRDRSEIRGGGHHETIR